MNFEGPLSIEIYVKHKEHMAKKAFLSMGYMPQKDFEKLQFAEAPEDFLKAVKSSKINQF